MLCKEDNKNQESIQSRTTPDLFDISVKKCNWIKTYQYTCQETPPLFLSNNANV